MSANTRFFTLNIIPPIDKVGFQIRKDGSTFSDMKTGSIPQIDAVIKTADNRIYKSTQNLNSTYTDADGNSITTKNAAEPLGASMNELFMNEYESANRSNTMDSGIIYDGEKFIICGYNTFAYSRDGATWNNCIIPESAKPYVWTSLAYTSGKYVAVSSIRDLSYSSEISTYEAPTTEHSNKFLYSTDGITWTETSVTTKQSWQSVCYGNGKFVAVGYNFDDNSSANIAPYIPSKVAAYSLDGITWAEFNMPTSKCWRSICYANNKFVAASGDSTIAYSTNGSSGWTEVTVPNTHYAAFVTYVLGKFVLVSRYDGIISSSIDGITWTNLEQDYRGIIDLSNWGIPKNSAVYNSANYESEYPDTFMTHIAQYDANTAIGYFAKYDPGDYISPIRFAIAKSNDLKTWTLVDTSTYIYENTDSFVPTNIICTDKCVMMIGSTNEDLIDQLGANKEVGYNWSTSGSTVALSSDKELPPTKVCNVLYSRYTCYPDTTYSAGDTDPHEDQNGGYVFSGWDKTGEITLTPESDFRTVVSGIWEWKNFYRYSYSWNADTYSDLNVTLPTGDYVPSGSLVNVDTTYNSNSAANVNLGTWQKVNLDFYQDWSTICYGNEGIVLASRYSSDIAYSTDGINWELIETDSKNISDSCYANGEYYFIGYEPNCIYKFNTSDKTMDAYELEIPSDVRLTTIYYSNNIFIATCNELYQKVYAYSTDGTNWYQKNFSSNDYWGPICYGNGKFVAIVNATRSTYLYSTDGINWTKGTLPSSQAWNIICYGNGKFVIIASPWNGSNIFAYSTDGINWTQGTLPNKRNWGDLCYGNGKFIAVATSTNTFIYSTDGITWTESTIPTTSGYQLIAYTHEMYITICSNNLGVKNEYAYSTDGITWTKGTMISGKQIIDVLFCRPYSDNIKMLLNTGDNTTNLYRYDISQNISTLGGLTSDIWKCGCFVNDILICISDTKYTYGYITSTPHKYGSFTFSDMCTDICYGNGKFIVVGYSTDKYMYSTEYSVNSANINIDNITWTEGTLPVIGNWTNICYGNGKFLIFGESEYCYSTDGINWTQGTLPDISYGHGIAWTSICYGNGKFLIFGESGYCYSTDGINWSYIDGIFLCNASYSNGLFIACTANDSWVYSDNAIDWFRFNIPDDDIYNVKLTGDYIIAIPNGFTSYMYSLALTNKYYSFSGWNKSDFNITSDTTISGTWSKTNMLSVRYSWNGLPTSNYRVITPKTEYFIPNNSVYVDTNYNDKTYKKIFLTWTQGTMPSSQNWYAITYGYLFDNSIGRYVAIADNSNVFAYSSDGITWTQGTMPSSQDWTSVCYGNGKFVAISGYPSASNVFAYSSDGITWTQGTLPNSLRWKSICYGNGKFVAVGCNEVSNTDTFAYSSDGITWTSSTFSYGRFSGSICYGNGKFVASVLCNNGASVETVACSTDGISWSDEYIYMPSDTYRNTNPYNSICYGNGKFVAVQYTTSGSSSIYIYSTDGINWTQGTMPRKALWNYVISVNIYANNVFIATVDSSTNTFAYSYDAITWKIGNMPSTQLWWSLCYGDGKVLMTATGSDKIAYIDANDFIGYFKFSGWNKSTFNITSNTTISGTWNKVYPYRWDIYSRDSSNSIGMMPSVCYGNGKFVSVAQSTGIALYSSDGITWTETNLPSSQSWTSVCYGNGKFVAIATNSSTFAYSTDGITWTAGNMPSSQKWYSVCYGNGKFVAISGYPSSSNVFAYSTNGTSWTSGTMPSSLNWKSICYGNGKFVAIAFGEYSSTDGSNSTNLAYSTNGTSWTAVTVDTSDIYATWSEICYGNGKFVAVAGLDGKTSKCLYSTDGITWNKTSMPSFDQWWTVCYGKNMFVAMRVSGCAYSYDGINWYENYIEFVAERFWMASCYGNGKFVVLNEDNSNVSVCTMGLPEDAVIIN